MNEEIFPSEVSEYFDDSTYTDIENDELVAKLEAGSNLETLQQSDLWKVFRETWHRIYKQAELELDNIDPSRSNRIAELQITKRFYRDVLGTTIRKIKEDAMTAFEHAKSRGLLNKLSLFLKKGF